MESERRLVERVLTGDHAAFRALVERYERLVRHVVRRLLDDPHDAEEVFQDVFVRVYRGLPNFRLDARLSTWIGRIAYNTAARWARRDRVTAHADVSTLDEGIDAARVEPVQLATLEERELRDLVRAQVARLPPDQRLAVTLYHVDGLSVAEVAEIMETPENTVKSHLFRGRKALKEMLTGRLT